MIIMVQDKKIVHVWMKNLKNSNNGNKLSGKLCFRIDSEYDYEFLFCLYRTSRFEITNNRL